MIFKFVNILYTLLFWPPFEYVLHYYLHVYNESRHKTHHVLVHKNNLKSFNSFWDLEYFYYILPVLFLFDFPILFWGSLWYFLVHTITHFKPKLLPNLSKHHLNHHKYPSYNFGITNTYLDYIFGTEYNRI